MKIELPIETWTEVFGFVPCSQLVQIVPHFREQSRKRRRGWYRCRPICDRQFVSFLQFYLHNFGAVTLGMLQIYSSANNGFGQTIAKSRKNHPFDRELPLADVQISSNIKNFIQIRISCFGKSVLHFLREFHRKSLFDNANLEFPPRISSQIQPTYMTNLVPLFTRINSIHISPCSNFLPFVQNEYSELAKPMLTSARFLWTGYNSRDDWYCDWLHIPREDGKPRVLRLSPHRLDCQISTFIEYIKKDFMEAKQAISFFINLKYFNEFYGHLNNSHPEPLSLQNDQTNETMVIRYEGQYCLCIGRHPIGATAEWIEEMAKYEEYPACRNVIIDF